MRRFPTWLPLILISGAFLGCALPAFEPETPAASVGEAALTEHRINTPSGPLYLVASPPRPGVAVVFIHGSPGTWTAFRSYLRDPDLAAAARLVSVDRPGFGFSSRGEAEPSLVRQAARIAEAVEALGIEHAVWVGHSLGGPVAARLAVDFPSLTHGLVLIAPSLDPALEKRRWYNVAASLRLVQWFLSVDWVTSNREIWPHRRELAALGPSLATVHCPVIVIQGLKDTLVPAANAAYAERAFTSAPLDVRRFPNDGHFILWQKPEVVRRAIVDLVAHQ